MLIKVKFLPEKCYPILFHQKIKIMKQLFITAIISLSLALCSCSGNNATKESNIMNAAGSPIATTSISTSDASFPLRLPLIQSVLREYRELFRGNIHYKKEVVTVIQNKLLK